MKTVLITGATRGLGLAFARQFAQDRNTRIVLLVRDVAAGQEVARRLGGQVEVVQVDMGSAASITAFVADWAGKIDVLVNNAGLQEHGSMSMSIDGVEMTIAVNHLGVLQLTLGLLPALTGGTVLGIGSGTHNPADPGATRFGFRGGRFTSIAALAAGQTDATTDRQAGMDRYATSKLMSMATSVELARRHPDVRFLTLDPGLMPGTGLARSAPLVLRLAWKLLLPLAIPFMTGASTPTRSARAGARLVKDQSLPSGGIYDFHAQPESGVWDKVLDPAFGCIVLDQSMEFLSRQAARAADARMPLPA